MIIEEWFVDKLPLLDLHDSLKTKMLSLFNPDTAAVDEERFEFTSNSFWQIWILCIRWNPFPAVL